MTATEAEGMGEKFDQRGVGFSLDSRGAETDLQNLAAANVGSPSDDCVGACAGLYANGEAGHKVWDDFIRAMVWVGVGATGRR